MIKERKTKQLVPEGLFNKIMTCHLVPSSSQLLSLF